SSRSPDCPRPACWPGRTAPPSAPSRPEPPPERPAVGSLCGASPPTRGRPDPVSRWYGPRTADRVKGFAVIINDRTPGSPCWLDLGTPDVPAAAAFYGAVFGWEYQPMDGGGEDMEGGMFQKDGKTVAGLGKLTEDGARSAWMIYYTVADADDTTGAVERAGGTVRVEPRDLGEWGRMAQYSDPLGAQFAVWQPGRNAGFELVEEPGSLCWTELYTTDAAAAQEFYGEVL